MHRAISVVEATIDVLRPTREPRQVIEVVRAYRTVSKKGWE